MKKNKITGNMFLRILAVIVAILVWVIVVNVSDPIIESTYTGIQVEILNADLISGRDQTYQVINGSNTITVTVMAKRSINDLLSRENIRATADMQDLNEEKGTIRIRLETNKYNDKIESITSKTEYVEVEIEDLLKRQFSITPVINGDPVEGYVVGEIALDQNVVSVQGPASIISQIDHVTAEASIAGMSGSISTTSMLRYYDAAGNQLDAYRLSGNISAVSIKVELLATKVVPLTFSAGGTPTEGYGLNGEISADVEEIKVAGRATQLANLSSINIPASAVDATDKDKTFTVTVDVSKHLPDNVILVEEDGFDGKVSVTVGVEALETRTIEVPKENFSITGLDVQEQRGSITETSGTISLTLKGLSKDLDGVNPANLRGVLSVTSYMNERNMTSIKEGVYDIPLKLELPEGVSLEEEDFTIECRIRKVS
ncbi:MAG: hypothetical protein J1E61_00155 [Lachnospiraceae bacterium]|nr:hypothetical protein [Lachnospiraceae bacterium]